MCCYLEPLRFWSIITIAISSHILQVPSFVLTINSSSIEKALQLFFSGRIIPIAVCLLCSEFCGICPQKTFVSSTGFDLRHFFRIKSFPVIITLQTLPDQGVKGSDRGFTILDILSSHLCNLNPNFNLGRHLRGEKFPRLLVTN